MGLLDLPNEIVPGFLAYLDVSALYGARRATRFFNNAWETHASSIVTSVLSRSIECYSEALQLEEVYAQRYDHLRGYEAITAQYKRIYLAAQAVSGVYRRFKMSYSSSMMLYTSGQEDPHSRKAYKRALYWFWRFSHAGSNGAPRLELRAPRDKAALADLHQWLLSDWRLFELNEYTWGIYRGCDFESEEGRYKTCVKQLSKDIDSRQIRKRWGERIAQG